MKSCSSFLYFTQNHLSGRIKLLCGPNPARGPDVWHLWSSRSCLIRLKGPGRSSPEKKMVPPGFFCPFREWVKWISQKWIYAETIQVVNLDFLSWRNFPVHGSLLPPYYHLHRRSTVLQHESTRAATPEPAGGGLAAVPPTLIGHQPAQHGSQPEPVERWSTLHPEPRYKLPVLKFSKCKLENKTQRLTLHMKRFLDQQLQVPFWGRIPGSCGVQRWSRDMLKKSWNGRKRNHSVFCCLSFKSGVWILQKIYKRHKWL